MSHGAQCGRHAPVPSAGVDTLSGGEQRRQAPVSGECGAQTLASTSGQCHHLTTGTTPGTEDPMASPPRNDRISPDIAR